MGQRIFITSTGTGIGKTFITTALLHQAKALGRSVVAYKPVMSGFDVEQRELSDTGRILKSLGKPLDDAHIDHVSPWRFTAPLAPSMAARMENRPIDFDALVAHGLTAMQGPENLMLIEGVGGVMAPLGQHHTVIDWIEALAIDTMLVVGSYLGTLSHTLTALEVLMQRGIPVFAIAVNETENASVGLQVTMDELANWTRLPLIGIKRHATENDLRELRPLIA
ncbi:MAG: dethiobiotin synthase [Bdellovibrionales bacterium]